MTPFHLQNCNNEIPMNFLIRMLDALFNVAACGGILYVGIYIGYLLHAVLY
jgi:hypothetical protein